VGASIAKYSVSNTIIHESFMYTTAIAIVASLIPDIDILKYGITTNQHRILSIFHKPIIWLAALILIWFLTILRITPISQATLGIFSAGILSHFILDTIGFSAGISWLWPWSNKNYNLFRSILRPKKIINRIKTYVTHPAGFLDIALSIGLAFYLLH